MQGCQTEVDLGRGLVSFGFFFWLPFFPSPFCSNMAGPFCGCPGPYSFNPEGWDSSLRVPTLNLAKDLECSDTDGTLPVLPWNLGEGRGHWGRCGSLYNFCKLGGDIFMF